MVESKFARALRLDNATTIIIEDMADPNTKITVHSLSGTLFTIPIPTSPKPLHHHNSPIQLSPPQAPPVKTTQLTPSRRPQKHLRRRNPQLPELPLLQAIAHPRRRAPRARLLRLRHLRRLLLLGLQARLRGYEVLLRGRRCTVHAPEWRVDAVGLACRGGNGVCGD